MSHLEGIFSRGDERLAALIERAYRLGCRFDGWSDAFRFEGWQKALGETGIRAEEYLRGRGFDEPLPWAGIDCGLTRNFLLGEHERAEAGLLTADCRGGECRACGVCDFESVRIVEAKEPVESSVASLERGQKPGRAGAKWRIKFVKGGDARFLSHLEVASALIRAIRQSGISVLYTEGFHPHPRLSFAHATAVGVGSAGEYADLHVGAPRLEDPGSLCGKINSRLPSGLSVEDIREMSPGDGELLNDIKGFEYEIQLPPDFTADRTGDLEGRIGNFLRREEWIIDRQGKDGTRRKDIRPCVGGLAIDTQGLRIILILLQTGEGTARPQEILTHVLGLDETEARRAKVTKKKTLFSDKIC
jgi:radical SAM-linked protein